MNTNIDGKRKVTIAMTAIKGVGRRYATTVLKKADVDLTKRAGECTEEEVCQSIYSNTVFLLKVKLTKLTPFLFFQTIRLTKLLPSLLTHSSTKSQTGF